MTKAPIHRKVFETLEKELREGRWAPGERLPSEAELVRRFGASRITVGRAVRDLQLAGLVERRAGSGTYARRTPPDSAAHSFGLLIPDLGETEIFEPICQGMMASPLATRHALVWGPTGRPGASKEERALDLCRHYVERRVSGVFFAPLEATAGKDEANRRIAEQLDRARIPVVLLDRTALPYPERGHHDIVGIDNRRAGFLMTDHLRRAGARRIGFVGRPHAAPTVDAREAGHRESFDGPKALRARLDPDDAVAVREYLDAAKPDGIVCANDRTAAALMHTLIGLGVKVPQQVRLAGIDDLEYARLLPVPLTTYRQPTRAIGAAALGVMLDRVQGSDLPTRDVLLAGELVVRRSCGA